MIVFGLNAQVRFGVKAGGTMSTVYTKYDGDKNDGFKARLGFQAGGMMEYQFSESFSLQPELMYVMNGAKLESVDLGVAKLDNNMTLHNIQVPINVKFKMGADDLKFYAMAGPYFGYIVSGKVKTKVGDVTSSTDLYDIDALDMKRFDFGIGVGLGFEITKFIVGVGYQYGIANLTGIDKLTMRSGTFNLSVGYFF